MALTFGGATSDRVNVGAGASIAGIPRFTILGWIYPTTLTSLRGIIGSPYTANGVSGIRLRLNGTTGNIQLAVNQTTATTDFVSNTNTCPVNTHSFYAGTYDETATPRSHIYRGDLTSALAETTYSSTNNGTGTRAAETGGSWLIGNLNNASAPGSLSFQGRISRQYIYNRVLTLGEMIEIQFRGSLLSGLVGYWELGFNGVSTQPDWSGNGNAGTVTGATLTPDHVPLGPPFGSLAHSPYAVSSGGSFLPAWARGSNQLISGGLHV